MNTDTTTKMEAMSEADLEPVLQLLQGADPDLIARKAGISRQRLFQIRDDLLAQVDRERAEAADTGPHKVGRNEPCPCGSGKKYKHCCLNRHQDGRTHAHTAETQAPQKREAEQARLIKRIETAFGLLGARQYDRAIDQASSLLDHYPNEDRLHDILATSLLYSGEYEAAIDICRRRLTAAESEKSYFIRHGRYRDAEIDQPALSYYYPPLTWLQKCWIALKFREYQTRCPTEENPTLKGLVKKLESADDRTLFPEKHLQGLELRRGALQEPLDQLKRIGPQVIPYLMPVACKYCWAGLFVPEILSAYETVEALQGLIDISMFGFAYASGASLHCLEKRGEAAIAQIQEALSTDREFDPIKTGIVSVLGNIQTPFAYEVLLELLEHESPHIVNWAGDALGKFKRVEALPAMAAASERIGGQQMIERAIRKLKDLECSS